MAKASSVKTCHKKMVGASLGKPNSGSAKEVSSLDEPSYEDNSDTDIAFENLQSGKVVLNMMNEIITQIKDFDRTKIRRDLDIKISNVSKQQQFKEFWDAFK